MNQVIPVFGCPADGRARAAQDVFSLLQAGLTSYIGAQGTNRFRRDGVLYVGPHVRFAEITDGTSNTLAVGERPPYPEFGWGLWYTGTWGLAGVDAGHGTGAVVLGVREAGAAVPVDLTCADTVYHFSPGPIANPCDAYHFWGLHFTGANFLFADGAVRFLSYSDDSLLPALATRAAGDIATLP